MSDYISKIEETFDDIAAAINDKYSDDPIGECTDRTAYANYIKNITGEGGMSVNCFTAEVVNNNAENPDVEYEVEDGVGVFKFKLSRGLAGEPGVPGKDGEPGQKGDKGDKGDPGSTSQFEFIYALSNEKPDTPYSRNEDNYIPITADVIWAPNPWSVSDDDPIEWVCKREKINGVWGNWSDPAIWAHFGKIGRDGNGIEYVYCLTNGDVPTKPESNPDKSEDPNDFPLISGEFKWYDDPQSVSATSQYCWVSVRKQSYTDDKQTWGPYSEPSVWAKYGQDGIDGGGRTVFAFCKAKLGSTIESPVGGSWDPSTNQATAPTAPATQNPEVTWLLNAPSKEKGEGIWMSTCSFDSNGVAQAAWSIPICITGTDGSNGADGVSVQFIYRLMPDMDNFNTLREFHEESGYVLQSDQTGNDAVVPDKIDNLTRDEYAQLQTSKENWSEVDGYYTISDTFWTDEPSGITPDDLVECVCTRTKTTDASGNEIWSAWSMPILWSVWGEDGMDGTSVEYIYTITAETYEEDGVEKPMIITYDDEGNSIVPAALRIPTIAEYEVYDVENGTNYATKFKTTNEFVPGTDDDNVLGLMGSGWTDEPQDVDENQPIEWVAIRKRKVDPETGRVATEWEDFGLPKRWARWSTDGESFITAYAFCKSNEDLNKYLQGDNLPKGGSYSDPKPNPSIFTNDKGAEITIVWQDSVPSDNDDLTTIWMTTRLFKAGTDEADLTWSIPFKMVDRSDFQVEFCAAKMVKEGEYDDTIAPTPENFQSYYDAAVKEGSTDPHSTAEIAWREAEKTKGWYWGDAGNGVVWMATCYYRNGKWTDWTVVKVKGEAGKNGTSVRVIGSMINKDCDWTDYSTPIKNEKGEFIKWVLVDCNGQTLYHWNDDETKYIEYPSENLVVGDGWLIDTNLWVWDGDSFENCGPIKGDKGDNAVLYLAFSDDSAVMTSDESITVTPATKGTVGRYIGYYTGVPLEESALTDSKIYTWQPWQGEDGWGQEQIFLLTKEDTVISWDHGPFVPTENKAIVGFLPTVIDTYKNVVSAEQPKDDEGNYTWSDIPLSPNKDYPFCWVATRNTNDWIWKGKYDDASTEDNPRYRAILYSRYASSGIDAVHLELSEDNETIPLDAAGNLDYDDLSTIAIDFVPALYYGDDIADDITLTYSLGEIDGIYCRTVNNGDVVEISAQMVKEYYDEQNEYPSRLFVYVKDGDNVKHVKTLQINYSQAAYDITTSTSILKKLGTGFLDSEYDKITVYVKKYWNREWINLLEGYCYYKILYLDGNVSSDNEVNISNGQGTISGLSKIKDISGIRFWMENTDGSEICFEEVGVIANGEDGAGVEYIYYLCNSDTAPANPTPKDTSGDYQNSDWCDAVQNDISWTDEPGKISADNKYQYVAERKKKEGTWQKFSNPVLWAKYSEDGKPGATTPVCQLSNPSSIIMIHNDAFLQNTIITDITVKSGDESLQIDNVEATAYRKNGQFYNNTGTNQIFSYTGTWDYLDFTLTFTLDNSAPKDINTYEIDLDITTTNGIVFKETLIIRTEIGGGENAHYYQIDASHRWITKKSDGTVVNPEINITPKILEINGNVKDTTNLPSGYSIVTTIDGDIQTTNEINPSDVNSQAIFYLYKTEDENKTNPSSLTAYDFVEIDVITGEKGEKGDPGQQGSSTPVIYGAGEYTEGTTYTGDAKTAPYVWIKNNDSLEYYVAYGTPTEKPSVNNSLSSSAVIDWETPTDTWIQMPYYNAIYSDIGVFKHALVGQWVFYKEHMFSQNGVNSNGNTVTYTDYVNDLDDALTKDTFIPNAYFNASTGETRFARGVVKFNDNGTATIGNFSVGTDAISFPTITNEDNSFVYTELQKDRFICYSSDDATFWQINTTGQALFAKGKVVFNSDGSGKIGNAFTWNSDGIITECSMIEVVTLDSQETRLDLSPHKQYYVLGNDVYDTYTLELANLFPPNYAGFLSEIRLILNGTSASTHKVTIKYIPDNVEMKELEYTFLGDEIIKILVYVKDNIVYAVKYK